MLSPLADIFGHFVCVPIQKRTNTKITFMGSLAMAFIFGATLIFVKTSWLIPVMIVCSKIGLASAYSLCYYMMSEYFPPLFLAFAFGITQFAARALTITAFPLSELEAPIPMILFSITPCVAFILLFFIKAPALADNHRKESLMLAIDDLNLNSIELKIEKLET
jgi:MFS family permease